MKRLSRIVPSLATLAGILCLGLLLVGCAGTDRIVIDGDTAMRMALVINEQMDDPEEPLRGNTVSNMRNGGYVYSKGDDLWFTVTMEFEDGSSEHYLQHVHTSRLGSLTAPNEILAPLRGPLVGTWGDYLLYVDRDNQDRLSYLDVMTFSQGALFDLPVAHAHLFDGKVYVSTQGQGDLHELDLVAKAGGAMEARPTLLYVGGGQLAGVANGIAYMLGSTEGSSVIRRIDIASRSLAGRIVGGPYRNLQVAGSWLVYQEGAALMRQPLAGGDAQRATTREISEYAVWGPWLAFIGKEGGIHVSHLDGTGVVRIAEDRASGLQLLDNRLFYRNAHDGDAIYVIDLVEGKRSALLGITQTDGGVKFLPASVNDPGLDAFVASVVEKRSTNDQYWGTPCGPIIFAEVARDGSITYYRHVDDEQPPETESAVVVVTTDQTILGQYTDGGIAYRLDRKLTLFTRDHEQPWLTLVVEGRPPSEIKSGAGDREGIPLSWHQKALNLRSLVMEHGKRP